MGRRKRGRRLQSQNDCVKTKIGRGGLRPHNGKLESQNDNDHISGLPNEILVYILCFLPTEQAMITSVLSRRWKNLWTNMPKLEFYWRKRLPCSFRPLFEEPDVKTYVNLVNQVMTKTTTGTIEELTIGLPLGSKYSGDINTWVEYAARKQVKKLKLDFGIKQDVKLFDIPRYFPSHRGSLPYDGKPSYEDFLAAAYPSRSGSNTNNNVVRLYWLKDLNLRGVDVGDEAMECLFSNSPFLERLCVIDSQKLEKLEARNAPNLKYLELRYCNRLQHLDISAPNLDTCKLFNRGWLVRFNIDAPILSCASFNVYPDIGDFFCLDKPKMLEYCCKARMLSFDYIGKPPLLFDYFLKLLGQFSHVNKRLALGVSTDAFSEICDTVDFSNCLPDLSEVEHLRMKFNPWPTWYLLGNVTHEDGDEMWLNHLWPCALVKAAPFLQKLSIKLSDKKHEVINNVHFGCKFVNEDRAKKVETFLTRYGHYSHQHLKEVELLGFTGSRNEVEIVLYLVEIAATSLVKICIHVCLPSPFWPAEDVLRYQENQHEQVFRRCAELLKAHIPPHIVVVII